MKKTLILILGLSFTAVSCNQLVFGGSGNMGVFRSDEAGSSFRAVNTVNKKSNLNSTSINSLVIDPANSQHLFLAAAAGIVKTEDAGNGWNVILTNIAATDVAPDPTDSSTIYATGTSQGHGKIVKTTDNAGSWKELYSEPTSNNVVTTIAVDPTNHNHVAAGLSAGEIIESQDAGATWQVATDLHNNIYRLRYGPDNNLYALTTNNGLYVSRDLGKTFASLTGTLINGYISLNSNFSAVSRFLDLAFDKKQPGVIYLATDAGLVRTVNAGTSWSFMQMPVRNSALRTSAIAVNPQDSNNLYAVVGNTMFISLNGGVSWETKLLNTSQEVRQIIIDGSSPNVIYLGLGVKK